MGNTLKGVRVDLINLLPIMVIESYLVVLCVHVEEALKVWLMVIGVEFGVFVFLKVVCLFVLASFCSLFVI